MFKGHGHPSCLVLKFSKHKVTPPLGNDSSEFVYLRDFRDFQVDRKERRKHVFPILYDLAPVLNGVNQQGTPVLAATSCLLYPNS
jgi:hypothetical protein